MDIDFNVVFQHWPELLEGLKTTLLMVFGSLFFGILIGLVVCFGKLAGRGLFRRVCNGYVDVFRTVPEMLTIFWIYNCVPLIFDMRLSSNGSGLLALSLVAGAFLAEVFRGGIQAVPHGQVEAAWSLGVPDLRIWRSVILPQATRIVLPAFIAFFTDLVKVSALLSTISVTELFFQATIASGMTFRYFEFFTAVGIIYFCIICPMSLAAEYLEVRLRGRRR